MASVLIVPTFTRPEMLWLCLERLHACRGIEQVQTVVSVDSHGTAPAPPLADIERALANYALPVSLKMRPRHCYHGNSYNVLSAFREAYEAGAELVFLIEDDVMVEPDFLEWHLRVQHGEDCFASIALMNAWETRRSWVDYASLGVCLRRRSLEAILPHAVPEYFRNMVGYIRSAFVPDPLPSSFHEQDGLIRRVMRQAGGYSRWPLRPRARHVGWYGYHRQNGRPAGNLRARVLAVRQRIEGGYNIL